MKLAADAVHERARKARVREDDTVYNVGNAHAVTDLVEQAAEQMLHAMLEAFVEAGAAETVFVAEVGEIMVAQAPQRAGVSAVKLDGASDARIVALWRRVPVIDEVAENDGAVELRHGGVGEIEDPGLQVDVWDDEKTRHERSLTGSRTSSWAQRL